MLAVVRELVGRGDEVRFYSFSEFREKIERTGAAFVSCDQYLPALSAKEAESLKKVSTSTFAFNQVSSAYMKNSPKEIAGLMLGLPRISRELNKLKAYGYRM